MITLNSYLHQTNSKCIFATIIGEEKDKWILSWHCYLWKNDFTTKHKKNEPIAGTEEVMMNDTPVKRIGDKTILETDND
jgi:hypothetical protein